MPLTPYDFMNRPEMRVLIRKRKLKVYMNSTSATFRLALIQDDLSKGINPYVEVSYDEAKKSYSSVVDREDK